MTRDVNLQDIDRFRAAIASRLGLFTDDSKADSLGEVLAGRARESASSSVAAYLNRLESAGDSRPEWRILAERLTVAETYFFRNPDNFRALIERVLPERVRAQSHRRQLRLLSAGCASGEEAYSLAISVREHFPDLATWQVAIEGIDVNPAMVAKAKRARYSAWALRETPAAILERHFRVDGKDHVLEEEIRRMASFEERNLLDPDSGFWRPGSCDVILCRNVTMYFAPEVTRRVIARLSEALAPGGYLFLGHAETLRGVSNDFHLCHTHETFYYQRREERMPPPAPESRASVSRESLFVDLPSLEASASWVDVIRGASDRIESLARNPSQRSAPGASSTGSARPPRNRRADISLALELLKQERFKEALEALRSDPSDREVDADAELLRAVLLTNCGNLAEAENSCRCLLKLDELNAGAHYLMALCREHARDRRGSFEHDRIAVYLDPSFAMPHFHLGLLAKRSGDLGAALRELDQAADLLARDDPSRILLFGGGFNRETLLRMCRAERNACGGAA